MKRKSAKPKRSRQKTVVQDKGLYTLEVFLVGGPVADDFVKKNPVVSRTIQIRADQTLAQLHAAIFEAFDRDENHIIHPSMKTQMSRYGRWLRHSPCTGTPIDRFEAANLTVGLKGEGAYIFKN